MTWVTERQRRDRHEVQGPRLHSSYGRPCGRASHECMLGVGGLEKCIWLCVKFLEVLNLILGLFLEHEIYILCD